MCDKIPLYRYYCCYVPLRLGLVFIAIQSIVTGVAGLTMLETQTDVNYNKLKNYTDNLVDTGPRHLFSDYATTISYALILTFFIFIFVGVLLLFTTLWDNESLIVAFIWGISLNVSLGYAILTALGISCIFEETCILSSVDWISAAIIFLLSLLFISLWLYYLCIAYSYLREKKSQTN